MSRRSIIICLMAMLLAVPCLASSDALLGEEVTKLQTALYALGYLEAQPDGVYGDQTKKAVVRLLSFTDAAGLNLKEAQLYDAWAAGKIVPVTGDLKYGDQSEAVMLLQRRLRSLKYLADKADGRFGDNTERALELFQRDSGLPLTGIADDATRETIFSAQARSAAYPVLAKGMQTEDVLSLQKRLALMGFFAGDLDGQYGEMTVVGVKALETYIRVSGKFDDWPAILREVTPRGVADPLLLEALYGAFPLPPAMDERVTGQEVYRLQRRLSALGYLEEAADGGYGENTKKAVAAFQKQAGKKASGIASEETVKLLFSSEAPLAERPYRIVIDLSDQALYVFRAGSGGKLVSTMAVSTGENVAEGRFEALTRPDREWAESKRLGWVTCLYQIDTGLYMHSVPFDVKGGRADTAYLSRLGSRFDGQGILLAPENARLIWQRCKSRTPIEIRP